MGIFLDFLKYIFLGIVQGITEVLPISSSGHVVIAQLIMGVDTDHGILFLIFINLGSLVAVVIHFRKIIFRLIKGFLLYVFFPSRRKECRNDFHYGLKILLASIPIGFSGFFLSKLLNEYFTLYALPIVALGLLATATLLYLVRNSSFKNGRQTITYHDAMTIGFGQMFAIIPGFSRSGVTTTSGLLRKLSMETVLIFSFMLYIPVSIGSFLKYLIEWGIDPLGFDLGFDPQNPWQYGYYAASMIFSFVATMFSLKFLFIFFRKGKLIFFSIYTFVLGLIAFVYSLLSL
jgi:undecaprenyl-diphosphatase